MKLNIYQYMLYILLMSIAMLSEYFFGTVALIKNLSYVLFIFPVLNVGLNFWLLKGKGLIYRVCISLFSGIVFFIVGYLIVLMLAQVRISLGLGI